MKSPGIFSILSKSSSDPSPIRKFKSDTFHIENVPNSVSEHLSNKSLESAEKFTGENLAANVFTQDSTPQKLVWQASTSNERKESSEIPLNQMEWIEEHKEHDSKFEELPNPRRMVHEFEPMNKISTCELELDTHASNILNCKVSKGGFGAEIWEEETRRRINRNLDPQVNATPPFTNTVHRPPTETELDFKSRLVSLYLKGKVVNQIESSKTLSRINSSLLSSTPTSNSKPDIDIYDSPDLAALPDMTPMMKHWLEDINKNEKVEIMESLTLTQAFRSDNLPLELSQKIVLLQKSLEENDSALNLDDDRRSESENSEDSQFDETTDLKAENNDSRLKSRSPARDRNNIQREIENILSCTQSEPSKNISESLHNKFGSNISIEQNEKSKDLDFLENDNVFHGIQVRPDNNQSHIEIGISKLSGIPLSKQSTSKENKRKLSLVDVFDKKKRKTAFFVDGPGDRSFSSPDQNQILSIASQSNNLSPLPLHPSNSKFILKLNNHLPPKRHDLDLMSKFQQPIHKNVALHLSDFSDLKVNSSASVSAKQATRSVLASRKQLIKPNNDIETFDGGYLQPSQIIDAIPEKKSILRRSTGSWNEPTKLPNQRNNAAAETNAFTPDDSQDDAFNIGPRDLNRNLQIPNVTDTETGLGYTNLSPLTKKYVTIQFSGILSNMKSFLLRDRKQPKTSLGMITRCFIPTFQPPLPASFHSYGNKTGENGSKLLSLNHRGKLRKTTKLDRLKQPRFKKSQIATPTPTNPDYDVKTCGMNVSKVEGQSNDSTLKKSRLTIMSLEIFCVTKKQANPNPKHDAIHVIAWSVDDFMSHAESEDKNRLHGILYLPMDVKLNMKKNDKQDVNPKETTVETNDTLITANHSKIASQNNLEKEMNEKSKNADSRPDDDSQSYHHRLLFLSCRLQVNTSYEICSSEKQLLEKFIEIVRVIDPDIFVGYEVQLSSWGYIISRAKTYGIDMLRELSRIPSEQPSNRNEYDEYAQDHESGIFITGRIILNLWRSLRSELKLMSYTYCSIAEHLLHCRFPFYSFEQLTSWFRQDKSRYRTVEYLHQRSELNLLFIDKLDLIYRTSESARLYGIDFFSVISRGSQYRVEAALLVRAHQSNYVAISPSKRQVANQAPMSVIPLVMEPDSKFYHDPVLVLDFQSLYPSMIIAYNLCFTTCIGQLLPGKPAYNRKDPEVVNESSDTRKKLGVIDYPEKLTAAAAFQQISESKQPYVSPNGAIFCAKEVRQGILPLMLKEMLDTRVMVKKAMKEYSNDEDRVLRRILDARQLAIKLLANVTCAIKEK